MKMVYDLLFLWNCLLFNHNRKWMITPNISRPKYNNFVDTASGDNTLQDKI